MTIESVRASVVGAPPGWYPDPNGVYPTRWWTGDEWTLMITTAAGAIDLADTMPALAGGYGSFEMAPAPERAAEVPLAEVAPPQGMGIPVIAPLPALVEPLLRPVPTVEQFRTMNALEGTPTTAHLERPRRTKRVGGLLQRRRGGV